MLLVIIMNNCRSLPVLTANFACYVVTGLSCYIVTEFTSYFVTVFSCYVVTEFTSYFVT